MIDQLVSVHRALLRAQSAILDLYGAWSHEKGRKTCDIKDLNHCLEHIEDAGDILEKILRRILPEYNPAAAIDEYDQRWTLSDPG